MKRKKGLMRDLLKRRDRACKLSDQDRYKAQRSGPKGSRAYSEHKVDGLSTAALLACETYLFTKE